MGSTLACRLIAKENSSCIDVGSYSENPCKKSYTICFGGDTSLGDYYLKNRRNKAYYERLLINPHSFFDGVRPLVNKSDYIILNFESVLADSPTGFHEDKKYPNWDNPERTIDAFRQLGVSAVGLANNHTMDFGPDIMLETKGQFEQEGIKCFGAGVTLEEASKPLKLVLQGERSTKTVYVFTGMRASKRYRDQYKVFADTKYPGVNPLDIQEFKWRIRCLRKVEPDSMIIVFPHWQGLDYRHVSPRIKKICDKLIGAGADYVFAHGTHTYDHLREVENGIVVNSIGQFVFNSPGRYGKFNALPYSVIVKLELLESESGWQVRHRLYPILSDNKISGFRTRLIMPSEAVRFHKFVDSASTGMYKQRLKEDSSGLLYLTKKKLDNDEAADYSEVIREMIKEKIAEKQSNIYHDSGKFSPTELISKEFKALGCPTKHMGDYLSVYVRNERVLFYRSVTSNTSLLGARILKNKDVARSFFQDAGISVAKGKLFNINQKERAKHFALNLPSAVLKPVRGNKSKGVTVSVKNPSDFIEAWETAVNFSKQSVLVEEQFNNGIEARYLVVGGKCIAVAQRVPPHVIGNGVDKLSKLIDDKNKHRLTNPHLVNRLIKLDRKRMDNLKNQGYELSSVPAKGIIVLLDWKAGFSAGADSIDITDDVHPSFKEVAETAANVVSGLDIVGIDILAHDHLQKALNNNYIVIEANTCPGLGAHHFPVYGKPRNIAYAIAKHIINKCNKNC